VGSGAIEDGERGGEQSTSIILKEPSTLVGHQIRMALKNSFYG
jgi:hypothetical protein